MVAFGHLGLGYFFRGRVSTGENFLGKPNYAFTLYFQKAVCGICVRSKNMLIKMSIRLSELERNLKSNQNIFTMQ